MKLGLAVSCASRSVLTFPVLFIAALAVSPPVASAQQVNLVINGGTREITAADARRYDHICITGGARVTVVEYDDDKDLEGNLQLVAGSVYVDATSSVSARGKGYQ